MNNNYQKLEDEEGQGQPSQVNDLYSVQNSQKQNMINKESYLSEESQQSSAMSLELKQKVNDQFQRKKMEFYKMYNKNPKDYKEERGKRVGKSNKISYNIQGDLVDQAQDAEGEDELPEVDQYSDYYEEDEEEGDSPVRPGESKEDRDARKKKANEERAKKQKENKEKAKADKAAEKEAEKQRKAQEKEDLRK